MIGGKESMRTLGTSYREASAPLSSLGLGPYEFIIISVCLMELLQTWLEPYCSPGSSYFFGGFDRARGISYLLVLVPM